MTDLSFVSRFRWICESFGHSKRHCDLLDVFYAHSHTAVDLDSTVLQFLSITHELADAESADRLSVLLRLLDVTDSSILAMLLVLSRASDTRKRRRKAAGGYFAITDSSWSDASLDETPAMSLLSHSALSSDVFSSSALFCPPATDSGFHSAANTPVEHSPASLLAFPDTIDAFSRIRQCFGWEQSISASPFLSNASIDSFNALFHSDACRLTRSELIDGLLKTAVGIRTDLFAFDPVNERFSLDRRFAAQALTPTLTMRIMDMFGRCGTHYFRIQSLASKMRRDEAKYGLVASACASGLLSLTQSMHSAILDIIEGSAALHIVDSLQRVSKFASALSSVASLFGLQADRSFDEHNVPFGLKLMSVLFNRLLHFEQASINPSSSSHCSYLRSVYADLFQQASIPLQVWVDAWIGLKNSLLKMDDKTAIYRLEIHDPYQEFFISVDPSIANTFVLHINDDCGRRHLPCFITSDLAKEIFNAGQSLRLLRDTESKHPFIQYLCTNDCVQLGSNLTFSFSNISAIKRLTSDYQSSQLTFWATHYRMRRIEDELASKNSEEVRSAKLERLRLQDQETLNRRKDQQKELEVRRKVLKDSIDSFLKEKQALEAETARRERIADAEKLKKAIETEAYMDYLESSEAARIMDAHEKKLRLLEKMEDIYMWRKSRLELDSRRVALLKAERDDILIRLEHLDVRTGLASASAIIHSATNGGSSVDLPPFKTIASTDTLVDDASPQQIESAAKLEVQVNESIDSVKSEVLEIIGLTQSQEEVLPELIVEAESHLAMEQPDETQEGSDEHSSFFALKKQPESNAPKPLDDSGVINLPIGASISNSLFHIWKCHSYLIAKATLMVLFRDGTTATRTPHDVRFQFNILESFYCFQNGVFTSLLGHILFSNVAEEQRDMLRNQPSQLALNGKREFTPSIEAVTYALRNVISQCSQKSTRVAIEECVTFEVMKEIPSEQGSMDFLGLAYNAPKPFDAIIKTSTICNYNAVFAWLLTLMRANAAIDGVCATEKWTDMRKGQIKTSETERAIIINLFNHLHSLVKSLQYYAFDVAVGPTWHKFKAELDNAASEAYSQTNSENAKGSIRDFHSLRRRHEVMVEDLMKALFLSPETKLINKSIEGILQLCIRFSRLMQDTTTTDSLPAISAALQVRKSLLLEVLASHSKKQKDGIVCHSQDLYQIFYCLADSSASFLAASCKSPVSTLASGS